MSEILPSPSTPTPRNGPRDGAGVAQKCGGLDASKLMPGSIACELDPLVSAFHSPASIAADTRRNSGISVASGVAPSSKGSVLGPDKEQAQEAQAAQEEHHVKSSRPEVLIMVQPSLKKQQHHPYNLQIQLLSPNNAHGSAPRGPSESNEKQLMRTDSNSSGTSAMSDVSVGSGNFASRRTIPLYNLNFHSIRASFIVDASTDQQVGKFSRRGVEIDDFGTLQPYEIVYLGGKKKDKAGCRERDGTDRNTPGTTDDEAEGDSPSARDTALNPQPAATESMVPDPEEHGKGLRKFMRGVRRIGDHLRTHGDHVKGQEGTGIKRTGSIVSVQTIDRPSEPVAADSILKSSGANQAVHHVSHLTPGAGLAHGKLTMGYYWEIKKFARPKEYSQLKPTLPQQVYEAAVSLNGGELTEHAIKMFVSNTILSHVWTHFNVHNRQGAQIEPPSPDLLEPHFEWVRDAELPGIDSSMHLSEELAAAHLGGTPHTQSRSMPSERDMEDVLYASWTCYIVLDKDTRIPIGQLRPIPHHPSLVCQLALPNPLPDLRFTCIGKDGYGFSREELRDIVAVTATHLTVREALGNLQRV